MKKYILTGILSEIYILEGSLEPIKGVSADLSAKETIKANLSSGESVDPYEGPYEVTPKVHSDQVLETVGKRMTNNVEVFKVPRWNTSNKSGITVYIGVD